MDDRNAYHRKDSRRRSQSHALVDSLVLLTALHALYSADEEFVCLCEQTLSVMTSMRKLPLKFKFKGDQLHRDTE